MKFKEKKRVREKKKKKERKHISQNYVPGLRSQEEKGKKKDGLCYFVCFIAFLNQIEEFMQAQKPELCEAWSFCILDLVSGLGIAAGHIFQ